LIDPSADHEDVPEALYGTNAVSWDSEPQVARLSTKRDGFWWGRSGYRRTRVSGVLVAQHLLPWTIGTVTPQLWHHPSARYPLEVGELRVPQVIWDEQQRHTCYIEGSTGAEVLGVPPDVLNERR
jgi:hypothetical protein